MTDVAGLRRLLDGWEDGIDLRDDIAEALLYPVESNSLRALLAVAEAAAHYLKHGDQRGKLVRALAALAAPAEAATEEGGS